MKGIASTAMTTEPCFATAFIRHFSSLLGKTANPFVFARTAESSDLPLSEMTLWGHTALSLFWVYGIVLMSWIPFLEVYSYAISAVPPLHPPEPPHWSGFEAHERISSSDRTFSFFSLIAICVSNAVTDPKVQHDPQCPWFLTGVTTLGVSFLQSFSFGSVEISSHVKGRSSYDSKFIKNNQTKRSVIVCGAFNSKKNYIETIISATLQVNHESKDIFHLTSWSSYLILKFFIRWGEFTGVGSSSITVPSMKFRLIQTKG